MKPRDSIFAAIDVGTNATRIKLVRRRADGKLQVLHQQRDAIRPGEGVFQTGAIAEPVANRLVGTLRGYGELCRLYRAHVRAVATSAIREAANRERLIARVRAEAGLHLEAISGEEEARLVCLGALGGAPPSEARLCIDLGGGSTEVVLALGERAIAWCSLPLGALRLTEVLAGDGVFRASEIERLRALAAEEVSVLPSGLAVRAQGEAIGCSGTLRALCSFAAADVGARATAAQLSRAVDGLVALGRDGRRRRFDARRAEVVVAGAVILEALIARLSIPGVQSVKRGLRDGILLELARSSEAPLARAAV